MLRLNVLVNLCILIVIATEVCDVESALVNCTHCLSDEVRTELSRPAIARFQAFISTPT